MNRPMREALSLFARQGRIFRERISRDPQHFRGSLHFWTHYPSFRSPPFFARSYASGGKPPAGVFQEFSALQMPHALNGQTCQKAGPERIAPAGAHSERWGAVTGFQASVLMYLHRCFRVIGEIGHGVSAQGKCEASKAYARVKRRANTDLQR
jgi:hypothetical protein